MIRVLANMITALLMISREKSLLTGRNRPEAVVQKCTLTPVSSKATGELVGDFGVHCPSTTEDPI